MLSSNLFFPILGRYKPSSSTGVSFAPMRPVMGISSPLGRSDGPGGITVVSVKGIKEKKESCLCGCLCAPCFLKDGMMPSVCLSKYEKKSIEKKKKIPALFIRGTVHPRHCSSEDKIPALFTRYCSPALFIRRKFLNMTRIHPFFIQLCHT